MLTFALGTPEFAIAIQMIQQEARDRRRHQIEAHQAENAARLAEFVRSQEASSGFSDCIDGEFAVVDGQKLLEADQMKIRTE